MPTPHTPRFGHTLRLIIEEKLPEHLTAIGNVNLRSFSETVDGYQYESIRKAAVGEREPTIELLEAVAKALDVPPATFYEYELLKAREAFDPDKVGLDTALENVRLWLEATDPKPNRKQRKAPPNRGLAPAPS